MLLYLAHLCVEHVTFVPVVGMRVCDLGWRSCILLVRAWSMIFINTPVGPCASVRKLS